MYEENKEMEQSGHGWKYEMSNHHVNVKRRHAALDHGNTRIPSASMKSKSVEIRQEEAHLPNTAVHARLYCYARLNDALNTRNS
jgi:hypothetical protein